MLNPSSPIDFTIPRSAEDFAAFSETELLNLLRQVLIAEAEAERATKQANEELIHASQLGNRIAVNRHMLQTLFLKTLSGPGAARYTTGK